MKTESGRCRRRQPLACAARASPAGGPASPLTARERPAAAAALRRALGSSPGAFGRLRSSAPGRQDGKRPVTRSRGCTPPVPLAPVTSAGKCPPGRPALPR